VEAWTSAVSWLATKLFFKRAWSFLKEHWQIPFMLLWTIVTVVLSRRNSEALKDVISAKKESHKKQVDTLKKLHKDEVLKLKNLQQEYIQTIEQLEKRFSEQEQELSEKHIEDVKEIVIKSKGNSEEIKRKIENEFGIKFFN
tara:strand:+ start:4986 stop:5411 length:426 start_codon:yes stop_codon:yes gene_type:complete